MACLQSVDEFLWSNPKDEYDRQKIREELFKDTYNFERDMHRERVENYHWYDWEDDIIETVAHIEEHNRPRWWKAWFQVKKKRIAYQNLTATLL